MVVTQTSLSLYVHPLDDDARHMWRRVWDHVNPATWDHMREWLWLNYACEVNRKDLRTGFWLRFDNEHNLAAFVLTWS